MFKKTDEKSHAKKIIETPDEKPVEKVIPKNETKDEKRIRELEEFLVYLRDNAVHGNLVWVAQIDSALKAK